MHLIIRGQTNTPGKKDFTGAFKPESEAYAKTLHETTGFKPQFASFDNRLPFKKRFASLEAQLLPQLLPGRDPLPSLDSLAIFCHGWATGIQLGVSTKMIGKLLDLLEKKFQLSSDLHVLLYCCSTGDNPDDFNSEAAGSEAVNAPYHPGEGSFADVFRDKLCERGYDSNRVIAHTTAGHTTRNPYAVFFDGGGSPVGGIGGQMPVTPSNSKMWRAWVKLLKTPYRFEYPWQTIGEIHKRVWEEV